MTDEEKTDATEVEALVRPSRRARTLRVLGFAVLFVAAGFGVALASPWILPLRIVEGPLVQQLHSESSAIVWFTSRGADCRLTYTVDGIEREASVTQHDWRHVARLEGLRPGTSVPYAIHAGRARLGGATLRTEKPPGSAFDVVIFGDSGRGTREQYLLARDMERAAPDLILHTGDLIYPGGERYHFRDRFFRPYATMLAEVGFWPSLGNHDAGEPSFGQPYLDVFELPENGPAGMVPERNYWFDYAGLRVVVLDSNVAGDALKRSIAPWLREVLGAPGPRWRFVVFHHPPYTVGAHKPDLDVREWLVPVFDETGVDMVFSGHDHMFQRMHPMRGGARAEKGVTYVISSAGGARLYEKMDRATWPDYVAAVQNDLHSFTLLRVSEDEIVGRQIAVGGANLDEWRITKSAVNDQ